jgi:hypothetical protein
MVRVRGFVDAASFCWAPNVSVDVMNSEKEDMRGGATLLVCTAVGLSFLILFIADLVAPFFKVTYRLKLAEVYSLMPPVTRVASENAWVFAVLIIFVCASSLRGVRRAGRTSDWITLGICGQALVFWIAMFCFCYDGFTGPVSLTRGPQFNIANLLGFGWGVFPVMFVLMLIPMVAVLRGNTKK